MAVLAHQGFATALAAALKKNKIITINSLHLHDFTDLGRQVWNTSFALAYEHAFDYLCPCSYELGNWLKGFGVPYDYWIKTSLHEQAKEMMLDESFLRNFYFLKFIGQEVH